MNGESTLMQTQQNLEFNGQTTKYNAKAIGTYRHH